ncbi:MAG: response regulator transcription factor [Dehalococcoidia bacterium]|jgi:DNA-binding response OmpR family regulator
MAANGKGTRGKVVIVEDEAAFRNIFTDLLTSDGYNVLTAEDGESGWLLVRNEIPDVVLLDLALPRLHGFEVLKNIRADATTKDVPVIILTVVGEQENVKKGLKLGATDYLVKGFYSPREILMKINEILTKDQQQTSEPTKNIRTYKLSVKERKLDAARLEQELGLSVLFSCPVCSESVAQELIPDNKRTEGHWFSTHFICPNCKKAF